MLAKLSNMKSRQYPLCCSVKDVGISNQCMHPGCVLLSAGLSPWWLLAPGSSLSPFLCRRKEQERNKNKPIFYFFFSVEKHIGPQNTTSNFLMVQPGNLSLNRGGLMYKPQWRGDHGQGWCVWELMPLSHHCNPDLKPNSNWTQPLVLSLALKYHWERRYLQEEKPRVAAGGGSLVETWLGLLELILQASLGLSAWRVLSCTKSKFRSASFGIVALMAIWAAPQREVLKQMCLWRLSGTTHNPSECCQQAPASLPVWGSKL